MPHVRLHVSGIAQQCSSIFALFVDKVRCNAVETDKDNRLVLVNCCLEVTSACGPATLVHDLIVIYASYLKNDFVYRAMVTA